MRTILQIGLLSGTASLLLQVPIRAQTAPNSASCNAAVTVRDAEHCLRTEPPHSVHAIDSTHVYTLPELIDIAELNNPDGRIAWAQARSLMEKAGIARASYLPILTFAAEASDVRAIVPFPKPLAPRGYVTVEQPIAAALLELEYTLFDFGRQPRLAAAHAAEVAGALRLGRKQQQIAYTVTTLYYRSQLEEGRLTAARTILHDAETLRDNAQSQFDNGRATLPDLQNAKAGVAEAQFSLASAEGSVKKAHLALAEAIGVEPTTEIHVPPQPNSVSPDTLAPQVEALIHTAWQSRPDLLARAQDLKRAQASVRIARSAYLPSARISAEGGQTATWPTTDFGQLGSANVTTWSAAVSLKWEIFNAARQHEVADALAEQRAAAEEQRAAQDRTTREVWQTYVDYQTAAEQQNSAQTFLASAQLSYDSSLDAFQYGVRSLVDVVQAERQLAQARLAAVDANSQLNLSAAALTFALGAQP